MTYHILLVVILFLDRVLYNPKKFEDVYFMGVILFIFFILYIRYKFYLNKEQQNRYFKMYSVISILMIFLGILVTKYGSFSKKYTRCDTFITGLMIGT